jgi:hypothetical protein
MHPTLLGAWLLEVGSFLMLDCCETAVKVKVLVQVAKWHKKIEDDFNFNF